MHENVLFDANTNDLGKIIAHQDDSILEQTGAPVQIDLADGVELDTHATKPYSTPVAGQNARMEYLCNLKTLHGSNKTEPEAVNDFHSLHSSQTQSLFTESFRVPADSKDSMMHQEASHRDTGFVRRTVGTIQFRYRRAKHRYLPIFYFGSFCESLVALCLSVFVCCKLRQHQDREYGITKKDDSEEAKFASSHTTSGRFGQHSASVRGLDTRPGHSNPIRLLKQTIIAYTLFSVLLHLFHGLGLIHSSFAHPDFHEKLFIEDFRPEELSQRTFRPLRDHIDTFVKHHPEETCASSADVRQGKNFIVFNKGEDGRWLGSSSTRRYYANVHVLDFWDAVEEVLTSNRENNIEHNRYHIEDQLFAIHEKAEPELTDSFDEHIPLGNLDGVQRLSGNLLKGVLRSIGWDRSDGFGPLMPSRKILQTEEISWHCTSLLQHFGQDSEGAYLMQRRPSSHAEEFSKSAKQFKSSQNTLEQETNEKIAQVGRQQLNFFVRGLDSVFVLTLGTVYRLHLFIQRAFHYLMEELLTRLWLSSSQFSQENEFVVTRNVSRWNRVIVSAYNVRLKENVTEVWSGTRALCAQMFDSIIAGGWDCPNRDFNVVDAGHRTHQEL